MRFRMNLNKRPTAVLVGLLGLIAATSQAACEASKTPGPETKGISIEGTYRLVSRELPDGTKQGPPVVVGLITFTKEYRNFNVHWKDAKGKSFSVSNIATYTLTDKEYSEKSLDFMVNDEIGGKGISYDPSNPTGSSPVTVKEGRIEFQLPLHGEPSLVFEGNKFRATRPGVFIDYWEKVK
ncbi:MAG: hypothetical protein ACREIS_13875 [Nitrospiraceae bacterium]